MTTSTVLHADGTTTRTGVTSTCAYCGDTFEASPYVHIPTSWCSQKCRRHSWRLRQSTDQRDILPAGEQARRGPRRDAYESVCLMCGRTAGLWWDTAAEARRRTLAGLSRCTHCGGAMLLQAAYGRSRASA